MLLLSKLNYRGAWYLLRAKFTNDWNLVGCCVIFLQVSLFSANLLTLSYFFLLHPLHNVICACPFRSASCLLPTKLSLQNQQGIKTTRASHAIIILLVWVTDTWERVLQRVSGKCRGNVEVFHGAWRMVIGHQYSPYCYRWHRGHIVLSSKTLRTAQTQTDRQPASLAAKRIMYWHMLLAEHGKHIGNSWRPVTCTGVHCQLLSVMMLCLGLSNHLAIHEAPVNS